MRSEGGPKVNLDRASMGTAGSPAEQCSKFGEGDPYFARKPRPSRARSPEGRMPLARAFQRSRARKVPTGAPDGDEPPPRPFRRPLELRPRVRLGRRE